MAAQEELNEKPELNVELGPWDNETMRRSLWLRVEPLVQQGKGAGQDYELRVRALGAKRDGALITIRDRRRRSYVVEIGVDVDASDEDVSRVFSTTIANMLDGILSGRVRPGRLRADASDGEVPVEVLETEESVEDEYEDEADFEEEEPALPVIEPAEESSRVARAARKGREESAPKKFRLTPAPAFAFSIGTTFFENGAFIAAPANHSLIRSVELGVGWGFTRHLESDIRFMLSEQNLGNEHGDLRVRGQLGVGIAPGWKRVQIPLFAVVDYAVWQSWSKTMEDLEGKKPALDYVSSESRYIGIGVRTGVRRTWTRPGRRWKASLGLEIAVRYGFNPWAPRVLVEPTRAPNGELVYPRYGLGNSLFIIQSGLVFRFGRWREPA